ncbi:MAG: hypothetical protein V4660_02810 [Pseudomonadota bacterium]
MKKNLLSLVVVLGLTPLASFAATSTFQIHGSQCESSSDITRDQWGASIGTPYPYGPTSSGQATLRCPFTIDSTFRPTYAWMVVRAYDRHPNVNVTCTLSATDSAGNLFGSATGGTTSYGDPLKSFQVGGPLNLANPLSAKYFYATCTIPQAYNSVRSHLTTLDLNLSN